jgi:hypothetical protein
MTDDEVELVAQALAKAGGTAWYPGPGHGTLIRLVSDRYRERARLAITALDRHRAQMVSGDASETAQEKQHCSESGMKAACRDAKADAILVGATVIYRPSEDSCAYAYRVERVSGQKAYLVPVDQDDAGWVPISALVSNAH